MALPNSATLRERVHSCAVSSAGRPRQRGITALQPKIIAPIHHILQQHPSMQLLNFDVGLSHPFFLIAGPCVIESEQLQMDVAGQLKEMT